jgi:DNA-directed RNA polymerase III subunit RPC8
MFILSRISDIVKLFPSTEYSHQALTQWLNAKYSNRVIHKVGLCIAVYDILSAEDGAVKYGDGCVYIKSIHPSFRPQLTPKPSSA